MLVSSTPTVRATSRHGTQRTQTTYPKTIGCRGPRHRIEQENHLMRRRRSYASRSNSWRARYMEKVCERCERHCPWQVFRLPGAFQFCNRKQIADKTRHMISNDMNDISNNEIAQRYTHCEQARKKCKSSLSARLFLSSKGDYGMCGFRAD